MEFVFLIVVLLVLAIGAFIVLAKEDIVALVASLKSHHIFLGTHRPAVAKAPVLRVLSGLSRARSLMMNSLKPKRSAKAHNDESVGHWSPFACSQVMDQSK